MPDNEQTAASPDSTTDTSDVRYKLRNVRNVPLPLKGALIADAARDERSVTDVALCILADYFDLECPEAGNQPRSEPDPLSDQLQLRMPHYHPLWGALWAAAREWSTTESSAAIFILSAHYQLPYEKVRRGRKPKVAP